MNKDNFKTPFIFGSATASYQIEGAIAEDGKGVSIWDTFCMQNGNIEDGTSGKVACDHYHRYKDDVQLIKQLGTGNYRFSLAWARLFPSGIGARNDKGFDFYNRLIDELQDNGVTPWITLYHWDLPQDLQDLGGWTNPDCHKWFSDYATQIAEAFSDRVNDYFLLNEPSVVCYEGHLLGTHAPGLKSKETWLKAVHQQNMSAKYGYAAMKAVKPDLNVGSTFTYFPMRPGGEGEEYIKARDTVDCLWNRAFLDPLMLGHYPEMLAAEIEEQCGPPEDLKTPLDFVGLQHYSPGYCHPTDQHEFGYTLGAGPDHLETTDMGWPIDPTAFSGALLDFKEKYGDVPLYVTENGAAMPDGKSDDGHVHDPRRVQYFKDYLTALSEAMDQGVDVRGYFIWSLLDNFEWAFGLAKRFGIVYIDYDNDAARIPKDSYLWWQDFLAQLNKEENKHVA